MQIDEYERMFRNEGDYWWFVGRRRLVFKLLEAWFQGGKSFTILDIGCGTGAMAQELQQYGTVIAADLMPESLRYCRQRGLGLLALGDVTRLPFAASSFDLVVALDLLEHVEDDQAAISELKRVLKPEGRLVVTVPAYRFLWSNHDVALMHYRRYTARELARKMRDAGFQIAKLSYAVSLLFPLIAPLRILSRWRDRNKPPVASVRPVSPTVNRWLLRLQQMESRLVSRVNLPFGVTVVAVLKP